MHIVIMAGGGGTRLWPKSRLKKPKQLQSLISQDSMIKETFLRVSPLTNKSKIHIATNKTQVEELKKELPKNIHIIEEPCIRNTAPSIGLAALLIKDKNEPTAFLPSDHYVGNVTEFRKILKLAAKTAEKDYLVTIGIRPTDPDTGLGYIQIKPTTFSRKLNLPDVYEVAKFIEKPNFENAKKFVASGQYLWNAGIYVAKPAVILKLFKQYAPKIYQHLETIAKNPDSLEEEYAKMENISFDYAIAERAKKIAVIPGNFDWSDIGNWAKLLEKLSQKTGENVVVGCEHYGIGTKGCLIHGTERLVVTIGLKDVIVVDTPDAVLVCHKNKAQDVKKIVEKLKSEKKYHYL